jgi:hypothetical protein
MRTMSFNSQRGVSLRPLTTAKPGLKEANLCRVVYVKYVRKIVLVTSRMNVGNPIKVVVSRNKTA